VTGFAGDDYRIEVRRETGDVDLVLLRVTGAVGAECQGADALTEILDGRHRIGACRPGTLAQTRATAP